MFRCLIIITVIFNVSSAIAKSDSTNGAFVNFNVPPEFMDGDSALLNFFYSRLSEVDSVDGRVILQFKISKEGKVKNGKIARTDLPYLNDTILSIIAILPDWKPAKQYGKTCEVNYTLPLYFTSNH